MGEATRAARQQVVEARAALGGEVDELGSAARSALDVPAKVRRNPVQTAGLAAGAVFLAVGGPRRVVRGVERRLRGGTPPPPKTLLPKDVERAVDDLGPNAAAVRARLEREFARYLEEQRKEGRLERSPRDSALRLFEAFAIPFGAQASRRLLQRLFAADPTRPSPAAEPSTGSEALAEDAAAIKATEGET